MRPCWVSSRFGGEIQGFTGIRDLNGFDDIG